jgi:hypothetical protein
MNLNRLHMKEVYYKGLPYQFEVLDVSGKRQFQLYKDGVLVHSVEQSELDIKSIVSLILDSYYRNTPTRVQRNAA